MSSACGGFQIIDMRLSESTASKIECIYKIIKIKQRKETTTLSKKIQIVEGKTGFGFHLTLLIAHKNKVVFRHKCTITVNR